jgi:chaperonin GroEL
MVLNKLRGTIKAAAVRAPGFGELRKENLDDIAILTGAKTVSEREGYSLAETIASEVLGSATKVIVTADSTTIIGGEGSQDSIKERISDINAQIENSTNESATLILKERLARIDGGVAIIKVGAHSEIEMREKIDRIDDAIGATRAAVEEGIVVGGGVALCKIAEDLTPTIAQTQNFEHRLGRTILLESCLAPFRVILTNAGESPDAILSEMKNRGQEYNVKTREYCNFIDSGIIDPAKVARVAIENAVSIASMMLTTEVLMVQDPPTETKA